MLVVERLARRLLALQQRIYAGQNHLGNLSREDYNKEVEEPLANISRDLQFLLRSVQAARVRTFLYFNFTELEGDP